ncbi:adenylate kinase family enzyme [Paenibacillus sp. SORGH_AS338]|nr:adenylate kinase family enzyme [Paenibacillus sp. SORGH_AS_0338]
MDRVIVIGCSGSGKSTLSQKLHKILQLPYYSSRPLLLESELASNRAGSMGSESHRICADRSMDYRWKLL